MPRGRRRPEQIQRGELRNRWRDYPGACRESDGRALMVWRAFERVLGPDADETFVPMEEIERVARLGVPAARAILQFRRPHDGSRCFIIGAAPWLGRPAAAYGDGRSGPTVREARWQPFFPVDGAVVARSAGPNPREEATRVLNSAQMRREMEDRRQDIEDAMAEVYDQNVVRGR